MPACLSLIAMPMPPNPAPMMTTRYGMGTPGGRIRADDHHLTATATRKHRESRICLRLDLVQLAVAAAPGHQLLVAADFCDARAVENHDQVSHPNGAEPVRHENGDVPVAPRLPRPACIPFEELMLCLRVERGGWLVQRHHERLVAHEPARQCELLPLAVGDVHTFVPGRPE